MRHADSNVTLEHYAHIVGDAERVASENFSHQIGQNRTQLESASAVKTGQTKDLAEACGVETRS